MDARTRVHLLYCPNVRECRHVGNTGDHTLCDRLDRMLTLIADERSRAEARVLRQRAELAETEEQRTLVLGLADLVDPDKR